jgi:SAM-dependent methyltransferase
MLKKRLYVDCPLCGANDYRLRYPATASFTDEMNPNKGHCTNLDLSRHGDIVQCRQCSMVYNNPQPEPAELLNIYKNVKDPLYLEEVQARECTFKRSLDQVHRFTKPPGKILDVGCFTGTFMKVAAAEGWEVEGVELSSWAAGIARKAGIGTIYEHPLEQLSLPKNRFDVITLWDVIEHVVQPVDMLKAAGSLLKPGGILAFSTHMVDSMAARLLGKRYPFFMELHLVHFSRSTAVRMLNEQGYELLDIKSHHRIVRIGYFLEELSWRVKNPNIRSFIKRISTGNRLAERFIRIGLLGMVNVFSRKK